MNALWISDVFIRPIAIHLFVVWTVVRSFVQIWWSDMFEEKFGKTPANKSPCAKQHYHYKPV